MKVCKAAAHRVDVASKKLVRKQPFTRYVVEFEYPQGDDGHLIEYRSPPVLLAGAKMLFSANTDANVVVHVAIRGAVKYGSENANGCWKNAGGRVEAMELDAKRDDAPLAQYDAVVESMMLSSSTPPLAF
jgi:hypothetical protein